MKKQKVPKKSPLDRDELIREVNEIEALSKVPSDFEDAPEALPRYAESKAISIRLPVIMIQLLKGFAKQQGIGYQVLIKRWLDDRLRFERERLRKERAETTKQIKLAPCFPFEDCEVEEEVTETPVRVYVGG